MKAILFVLLLFLAHIAGGCMAVRAPFLLADALGKVPVPSGGKITEVHVAPFWISPPLSKDGGPEPGNATISLDVPGIPEGILSFYREELNKRGWKELEDTNPVYANITGKFTFEPRAQDRTKAPLQFLTLDIDEEGDGKSRVRARFVAIYLFDIPAGFLGQANKGWAEMYILMGASDSTAEALTWPAAVIIATLF